MKYFLLDVYKQSIYRVSKDTIGGYGTVNDFGGGFIPSILSKIKKETTDFPPLYMAYIASALKKQGHEVRYGKNVYPPRDSEVVLLSSSIVEHTTELEWGRRLKKAGFHVGYVGPFAGVLSDSYLAIGDFVVIGEPEFLFLKPVYKEMLIGKINVDSSVSMLDELPFPDWSCFGLEDMKYRLYGGGGQFFPMLASRGCPHSCCYYCTYPLQQGRVVRFRSAKNIVDEMESLKNNYGSKTVLFRDPIFGLNKNNVSKFLDELIRRDLGMNLVIETHLENLDDELIHKFRKAGLVTIKVGIESSNRDILNKSHRKKMEEILQLDLIRKIENAGIMVICFYMLGMPYDTWESCLATIKYAKILNTAGAQFSVCTPYPGTLFYEEVKNRITVTQFDEFTQYDLVYNHSGLTKEQIEKLKNIAYTSYYLRAAWIAKYLKMRMNFIKIQIRKDFCHRA